jgi:hypothetical protein
MMKNDTDALPALKAPRPYAPRWVSRISRILDGLYDGTRSTLADNKTKRIMFTTLKTLAKGNVLSEGLQSALVGNIRIRLGEPDFTWDHPIKLTRGQLRAARELLLEWEQKAADGHIQAGLVQGQDGSAAQLEARIADLEQAIVELCRISGLDVTVILPASRTIAAQNADKPLKCKELSAATEHNDTKHNHDVDVICLSGGMTTMELPEASNDVRPSKDDHELETSHGREVAERQPEETIAVSYFRPDPTRAPSAKLEIGDEKYNLIFHTAEVAEEKLRSACTAQWLNFYEETYGGRLRAQTRGNPTSDFRYVASPIYGAGDPFGFKKPVVDDCVAILAWGENGHPEAVIIFGDVPTVVPLRPSKLATPNAPTHKGSLRLAA